MPATAIAKDIVVTPFGVEIDTPRNGDLVLASIPGCRLRGGLDSTKPAFDSKTGDAVLPLDQVRTLGQFPKIPGMQLHVNPAELTYIITDPLRGNEDLCERIRLRLVNIGAFSVGNKLDGVPPQKGKLDVHRMKTLCRELINVLEANEAKMVKGPKPELEDVDDLPGNYLLNPGSVVMNAQPTFEKDWDAWYEKLTMSGG